MEEISSASLAFDLHTKLVEFRNGHPTADRLLHHGYYRAFVGAPVDDTLSRATLESAMKESHAYHEVSRTLDDAILTRADTVFLTDDLRELVNTAEATMPDEVLFATDIYTPCGFVVMETPITMDVLSRMKAHEYDSLLDLIVARGGSVKGTRLNTAPDEFGDYVGAEHWDVRAFAWGDIDSIKPDALADVEKRFGRKSAEYALAEKLLFASDAEKGVYVRVYGTMTGTTVDGLTVEIPEMGRDLRLMDIYAFFYDEDGLREEKDYYEKDRVTDEMLSASLDRKNTVRRFLVALFRLMEEYVDVGKSPLHRAHGRRASRVGRGGDLRNVTILSLRRALDDESDGTGVGNKVTLAHLVRGHWRNQWYPSQKQHRAKWIRAHRRGGNAGDEVTARPRVIKVDR
jgi:hypothetical protein